MFPWVNVAVPKCNCAHSARQSFKRLRSCLVKTDTAETFRGRLFVAYLSMCAKEGAFISQRELVRRIEKASAHSMSDSTFSRWLNDDAEPELWLIPHVAKVVSVDPGWLAFGGQSSAPAPELVVPMGELMLQTRARRPARASRSVDAAVRSNTDPTKARRPVAHKK